MTERITADQAVYIAVLNARHCLVRCPRCGAEPNTRCIGQYGRRTKSTHCARKDDAAKRGYVLGRRGDIERVRAWDRVLRPRVLEARP